MSSPPLFYFYSPAKSRPRLHCTTRKMVVAVCLCFSLSESQYGWWSRKAYPVNKSQADNIWLWQAYVCTAGLGAQIMHLKGTVQCCVSLLCESTVQPVSVVSVLVYYGPSERFLLPGFGWAAMLESIWKTKVGTFGSRLAESYWNGLGRLLRLRAFASCFMLTYLTKTRWWCSLASAGWAAWL